MLSCRRSLSHDRSSFLDSPIAASLETDEAGVVAVEKLMRTVEAFSPFEMWDADECDFLNNHRVFLGCGREDFQHLG